MRWAFLNTQFEWILLFSVHKNHLNCVDDSAVIKISLRVTTLGWTFLETTTADDKLLTPLLTVFALKSSIIIVYVWFQDCNLLWEGGLKFLKNARRPFPCTIALHMKKVCYKIYLCEHCQRQSCKAFTVLSIRAENGPFPISATGCM